MRKRMPRSRDARIEALRYLAGDAVAVGAEHVPIRRVGSRERYEPAATVARWHSAQPRSGGRPGLRCAAIDRIRRTAGARRRARSRDQAWFDALVLLWKHKRQLLMIGAHRSDVLRNACQI